MDKIRNIGPNIAGTGKDNPFRVPDGYFGDFPVRLHEKIYAQQKVPTEGKILLAWKPYLAAAIILVVALLTGNYFYRSVQTRKADQRFHAEVSRVVEQELYSISEAVIYEAMESKDPGSSGQTEISNDAAIDYLLNEGLSEEDLMNDF